MERTESTYSRNFVVTWSGYRRTPKIPGLEEERKKKEKTEEELLLSYPQLVTTLALLIGAGMPVSKAWGRMAGRYKKNGTVKNAAYEESVTPGMRYRMVSEKEKHMRTLGTVVHSGNTKDWHPY